MDSTLQNVLLCLCGIGAVFLLVLAYVWYFMFGKSFRRLVVALAGAFINRDDRIDLEKLDEATQVDIRPEEMKAELDWQADQVNFDSAYRAHQVGDNVPLIDDPDDPNRLYDDDEYDYSRFGRLMNAIRRPFLKLRYRPTSQNPAENLPPDLEI